MRRIVSNKKAAHRIDDLVAWSDPHSIAAEAYRMLRTNLQFTTPDKPLRTLLITSADPEEGKSTVAANLAASFGQAGQTVILINADLRRPTVHRFFGVSPSVGLTSVLVGAASLEEALQETDVDGVRILPSGPTPPNPAELLGSEAMGDVIAEARQLADFVLFDAPPLMAVTDPGLLAPRVDGCLLVVHAGVTEKDKALRAKEQLENLGAHIVGAVINRLDGGPGSYYYYYYDDDRGPTPASWWARFTERFKSRSHPASASGRMSPHSRS